MALQETIYGVKAALRDMLGEELNRGLAADSPERVNVFYGWAQADSSRRMIVISPGGSTSYGSAPGEGRFHAASSLRRYTLTYAFSVHIATSLTAARTEEDAEKESYRLLERVLTPLIRGDSAGRSLLQTRLPAISTVEAIGDSWDMLTGEENRQYRILIFELMVELIRD